MIRFLIYFILLLSISCTTTIKEKVAKDKIPAGEIPDVNKVKDEASVWENTTLGILQREGYFPKFIPNKDQFVYTDKNYNGLWVSALRTKDFKEITNARGAGYQPITFEDQIIYQIKGKKTTYHILDLNTQNEQVYSSKEEALLAAMKDRENYKFVDLATDLNALVVYEAGKKVNSIRPGDFSNYLNPSFSPDGQKILFEVSGIGGFVCGIDGEILHKLGALDQPSWINNEEVVYAKTEDDGMVKTSGEIYIQNIASKEETLISNGVGQALENPTVHHSGSQILANTENGELILMYKSK